MDAPLQANPRSHYEVNGGAGRNSRPGEDGALSQDVQECIQFFDDTIVSLEESLNHDDRNPRQGPPAGALTRPLSHNQDIIDLVRPGPDLVQTRELGFNPTSPDFQSMVGHPESHFELKPRHDQIDSLPTEYNPPLPSGSYGSTDSHSSYHPPGSIPTPVLIAQQIAENQASGTSNLLPSSLRQRSSDSDKPPGLSPDPPVKQGPPTSAKPSRFPANINVILGAKEPQSQPLANVNIHERRAQMLANLSGTSHPLLQEDAEKAKEQKPRNTPTRSISFRDPTPDISRMEALSKLGLTRNRALSGGTSLLPSSTSLDAPAAAGASAKPLEASVPPAEATTKAPEANPATPPQSRSPADRKAEVLRTPSLRSLEERYSLPSPSPPAASQRSFPPLPTLEHKASVAPPPEISSLEFNSYGGKSITVNPSVSSKTEPVSSPTSPEPKALPPALASPSEFNTYGGKTKVMNPAPMAVTRNNLPDILSSHINKSQTLPVKSEPLPIEPNSYGGKSRTINASAGLNRPPEIQAKSVKPPAPTPAPRPPRQSYHGPAAQPRAAHQTPILDHKRRPGSQFRPQGITVQFTGRGTSDESRKEALRKLGLMKES